MYSKGLFFLSNIQLDIVYKLPTTRVVDMKSILILYHRPFWVDIKGEVKEQKKRGMKRKHAEAETASNNGDEDNEDSSAEDQFYEQETSLSPEGETIE